MVETSSVDRLRACGIVPVLTIDDPADAVPISRALMSGGIDVVEVTLRTPCALEAISEIVRSDLDVVVGAGTISNANDVEAAAKAGSTFLVTPATTPDLIAPLRAFDGLVLPGVATPTEALGLYKQGFSVLKFFPAEPCGGAPFLKGIGAPLPDIQFMPTGGISASNVESYLKLSNVVAVGGSWLVPKTAVAAKNWDSIEALARDASSLVKTIRATG